MIQCIFIQVLNACFPHFTLLPITLTAPSGCYVLNLLTYLLTYLLHGAGYYLKS
jgi:hypothetical protein